MMLWRTRRQAQPFEAWAFLAPTGTLVLFDETADYGMRLLGVDGVGLAARSIYTTQAPFQRGETFLGARTQKRLVSLRCGLQAQNLRDLEQRQAALVTALDPENGIGTLQVFKADGTSRYLDCLCVSGFDLTADGLKGFARRLTLGFQAFDPRFYDPQPQIVQFVGQGGGLSFPTMLPWNLPIVAFVLGAASNLTYSGTAPTEGVWTFQGPLVNPYILHVGQNKWLRFNYTVQAGQTLTVDMRYGMKSAVATAYGSVFNVLPYLSSDSQFFSLLPGVNRLFVAVDAPTPGGQATVQYLNRYGAL